MMAVADVTRGVVHAEIDLESSPSDVFGALTDPEQLSAWWGSDETYRTSDWQLDLRPGGKWSCRARGRDGESTVHGEILELDPPKLLVLTWHPSWERFISTTIRYELTPIDGGTRLRVVHSGFGEHRDACSGHAEGWKLVLAWLAAHTKVR